MTKPTISVLADLSYLPCASSPVYWKRWDKSLFILTNRSIPIHMRPMYRIVYCVPIFSSVFTAFSPLRPQ